MASVLRHRRMPTLGYRNIFSPLSSSSSSSSSSFTSSILRTLEPSCSQHLGSPHSKVRWATAAGATPGFRDMSPFDVAIEILKVKNEKNVTIEKTPFILFASPCTISTISAPAYPLDCWQKRNRILRYFGKTSFTAAQQPINRKPEWDGNA